MVACVSGEMIESRGSLFIYESEFVAVTAEDGVSILAYRVDTDGSFLEAENATFTCPIGFTSKEVFCKGVLSKESLILPYSMYRVDLDLDSGQN